MPTTYTHFRHGEDVRKHLGERTGKIVEKYPELYHFGVHGPDLLFYYDALKKNEVNHLGNHTHELAGWDFFSRAAEVIREARKGNGASGVSAEALEAYIYGFLCHFSLDVCCHGYVQDKIDASGISHCEIEAELDRELLVMDGRDPVRSRLTGHLKPSVENARVVAAFYEGLQVEQVEKAMRDMVKFLNVIVLPNRLKRAGVMMILKITGHYEALHGLIINYEKNPNCADSNERLLERYAKAVDLAAGLIEGFEEAIETGRQPHEVYRYNFSSYLPENPEERYEV